MQKTLPGGVGAAADPWAEAHWTFLFTAEGRERREKKKRQKRFTTENTERRNS
jgi:hypothetical protein